MKDFLEPWSDEGSGRGRLLSEGVKPGELLRGELDDGTQLEFEPGDLPSNLSRAGMKPPKRLGASSERKPWLGLVAQNYMPKKTSLRYHHEMYTIWQREENLYQFAYSKARTQSIIYLEDIMLPPTLEVVDSQEQKLVTFQVDGVSIENYKRSTFLVTMFKIAERHLEKEEFKGTKKPAKIPKKK